MQTMIIKSNKAKEIIDITGAADNALKKEGVKNGFCHFFAAHTTCALTTADLDPGADLDMLDAFEALIPKLSFRHPHDPSHMPDHILSALIGTSLVVPVKNGNFLLGEWQRIVLVEFSGPRERTIVTSFMHE